MKTKTLKQSAKMRKIWKDLTRHTKKPRGFCVVVWQWGVESERVKLFFVFVFFGSCLFFWTLYFFCCFFVNSVFFCLLLIHFVFLCFFVAVVVELFVLAGVWDGYLQAPVELPTTNVRKTQKKRKNTKKRTKRERKTSKKGRSQKRNKAKKQKQRRTTQKHKPFPKGADFGGPRGGDGRDEKEGQGRKKMKCVFGCFFVLFF
jgi:hypothetical protein